ncbi:MAG: hypothetical protein RR346_06785 [Bacteroidales bacterium]
MKKKILSIALLAVLFSTFHVFGQTNTIDKFENIAVAAEKILALTGTSTGNPQVDQFLGSTSKLLQSYQSINTKISAFNILKNGKVSDGTNNLSKMAALAKLGGLTSQLGALGKESSSTVSSGNTLLKGLMQQIGNKQDKNAPTEDTLNKVKMAIGALSLLGTDLPASVKNAGDKMNAIKSLSGF